MMSQNPSHHADQRHSQTQETSPQGIAPIKSSGSETQPKQDCPEGSLSTISERSEPEMKEYWDPGTTAFSSPYYDPFGEGEEKEVKVVSPVKCEGVATIEAYNTKGNCH